MLYVNSRCTNGIPQILLIYKFATEMVVNFTNMCRLCMGEKDSLMPLFDEDGSLPDRIMTLVPVVKVCLLNL